MNFDKESKSEEKKFFFLGGGGEREGRKDGDSNRKKHTHTKKKKKKKTIGIRLFFVLMLYIKFQVPGSSGSLVLTQTKEVTDR